jgi:uncharacterized protein
MTHFYTGKGDDGYTGLLGEGRVPKYHPQPEAVGTVDEATSALGVARSICQAPDIPELVMSIQRDLYGLMAEVSATQKMLPIFGSLMLPGWPGWKNKPIILAIKLTSLKNSSCRETRRAGPPSAWRARSCAGLSDGWPHYCMKESLRTWSSCGISTGFHRCALCSNCWKTEPADRSNLPWQKRAPPIDRNDPKYTYRVGRRHDRYSLRCELPERVRQTIIAGLGLFTIAIGLNMFFQTENAIVVLISLLVGGLLGEWWRIEDGLRGLGDMLERRFAKPPPAQAGIDEPRETRFVRGFLTASLVFCIGPMAIIGSIQDGLTGDYSLLAIKSVLDGFASLAFASSLGIGVLFSTLVILVYQGGLSLLAAQAQALISSEMMNELTAVGGVLLLGVAISSILEIKPIRVGSFIPALAVAPLLMGILQATGLLPAS